ncbi:MAG: permease-like cell division protein FtsX [Flavobacteriales bacterium]|nr:permease-like cell division protein FtsX [Flavobacteriales bacterium]
MGIDRSLRAKARSSSIGTTLGITLTLFMLGALGLLMLSARGVERYLKEQVTVELYPKTALKEAQVLQLLKELDTEPYTASTELISAEEAAELAKKEMGEDFLDILGGVSPIPANIQLRIAADYAQPDSMRWIVEHLRKDDRMQDVAYNTMTVDNMDKRMREAWLIVGGTCLLLLIVAVALINNTIRLAIYSKRLLIRTMHLVGATGWFIKRPFLGQSLLQGLVAGLLAIGMLVLGLRFLFDLAPDLKTIIDMRMLAMTFAAVLLLGLVIALVSTWFAVRRYIRMDLDELHWS